MQRTFEFQIEGKRRSPRFADRANASISFGTARRDHGRGAGRRPCARRARGRPADLGVAPAGQAPHVPRLVGLGLLGVGALLDAVGGGSSGVRPPLSCAARALPVLRGAGHVRPPLRRDLTSDRGDRPLRQTQGVAPRDRAPLQPRVQAGVREGECERARVLQEADRRERPQELQVGVTGGGGPRRQALSHEVHEQAPRLFRLVRHAGGFSRDRGGREEGHLQRPEEAWERLLEVHGPDLEVRAHRHGRRRLPGQGVREAVRLFLDEKDHGPVFLWAHAQRQTL